MYLTLSNYYFDKCRKFADAQLETSKDCYFYRGENRLSKMREDIIIGKLGEVAAYKYLQKRGYKPNKPDFSIYERRNKSFDADLTTEEGFQVHVKSQGYDSLMRYGASWLLQKSDKITTKPTDLDFILMVNIKQNVADIMGVVSVQDLVENGLFEEPKVHRYARTKRAIYFDSIKHSGISLEAI